MIHLHIPRRLAPALYRPAFDSPPFSTNSSQTPQNSFFFWCTHFWMWHYGSAFLPRCVCLCNIPQNSHHSLQLCTVAVCVQRVRLSQCFVKSHQSEATQDWITAWVMYKSIQEMSGEFSVQINGIHLFDKRDWEALWTSLLFVDAEFLQKPKCFYSRRWTAELRYYIFIWMDRQGQWSYSWMLWRVHQRRNLQPFW